MANLRWLVVLAATGCGTVDHGSTPLDDAGGRPADAAPDGAIVDAAPVLDRNCTEVKARLGTATDGLFVIDPDLEGVTFKPFEVFCAGMATATPREYLELKRTSKPAEAATSNFSTYSTGAAHAMWTCDCGVATTIFTKIRIDPATLSVAVGDTTFAVYANSTQVSCLATTAGCPGPTPFAVASACVANFDDSGRANIDLRDMPFHVAGSDTASFAAGGFTPAGGVTLDSARKVASLTGGGDCGSFGASGGFTLAQDL